MELRPQLQTVLTGANDLRMKAVKRLEPLKPTQLAWSPGAGKWSIAQTLDHLNKVHALTIPKFEDALKTGIAAEHEREETIKPRFMDRVFLKMMSPSSPISLPVPPMFEPDTEPDPRKTVRNFFGLHDVLTKIIVRADDFRLREVTVVSPVSAKLRPGFLTYLQCNLYHEQYHWGQIERVLSDPSFPSK